jgi:hypothetical protein
MRPWLFMEDLRRKERRDKRVDPNLRGDIILLESLMENIGTTRSGILEELKRKEKEE